MTTTLLRPRPAETLEEPEQQNTPSTDPVLEPVARETRTGSGTQDDSITVIENASLEGYIGLLLAKHFTQKYQKKELIDVLYIRADGKSNIKDLTHYGMVSMEREFSEKSETPYNFVRTNSGMALPAFNFLPYEICFITPDEYDRFHILLNGFHEKLTDGKFRTAENLYNSLDFIYTCLDSMYRILGRKVPTFSYEDGKLILPDGYASFKFYRILS